MRIHIGNLSPQTDETRLRDAFAAYGEVDSASVVVHRATGRPREFGFVEMPQTGEAESAIRGLAGSMLDGRVLTVSQARPRATDGVPAD